MRTFLLSTISSAMLLAVACKSDKAMKTSALEIEQFANRIEWITNAATKFVHNGKTIYIDPWKLAKADSADLILITHAHHDHFSPDDIKLIASERTTIVCTADVAVLAKELGYSNITTVAPFDSIAWNGLKISTVPMYNIVKNKFHNRQSGWVGYIVDFDGITVYHAGDTERIPEMKNISCDIVLMPIGQTYTMNSVEEATEAVLDTKAQIAIPIHYDVHESQPGDPQRFAQILSGKVNVMLKK